MPDARSTFHQDAKKRIEAVIEYMLDNLSQDVPLQELSAIANYSPFHFQKLFKDIMGISPKQYMIKLRLERALHLMMIIHPRKPIKEISIECGYSSPAVFTRAIHNYFGLPPEAIRQLPLHPAPGSQPEPTRGPLIVQVKRIEPLQGIHLVIPSDDPGRIQYAFHQLLHIAASHDLYDANSRILGILRPHQTNTYKAFLSVGHQKKIPAGLHQTHIKAGKYASFLVKGSQMETLTTAHLFFQQWLPVNNYKISDALSFESFSENPGVTSYLTLERRFFVPIEPRD